ncbi:hypothetical protein [Streptomyces sp. C10]|uniref:hypothetical protein n=1 Tax=Streptomyces sp. C10 TaxID=531941 RepID=UPI00397ED0DD
MTTAVTVWEDFDVPPHAPGDQVTLNLYDHLAAYAPKRPGACLRISSDRFGLEAGVDHQLEDAEDSRTRLRWGPFMKVYRENDTSAFKKRKIIKPDGSIDWMVLRPDFRQLLPTSPTASRRRHLLRPRPARPPVPGPRRPHRHRRIREAASCRRHRRPHEPHQRQRPPHELADVISAIINRLRGPIGAIPLVAAYDVREKVWNPPMPLLFQRGIGSEHRAFIPTALRKLLINALAATGLTNADGEALTFSPHDFRRIFVTDAIMNGLPRTLPR